MIITWRIGLRIGRDRARGGDPPGLVLLGYTSIFGAVADFVGVVVVLLGLLGGGVIGAVCGFVTGLVMDSVLLQTLGVSSLVLLAMGYLAGRYREGFEISARWPRPCWPPG